MSKRKFCSDGCKECYIDDGRNGIVYSGTFISEENIPINMEFIRSLQHPDFMYFSHEEGCKILGTCYYCNEELKKG